MDILNGLVYEISVELFLRSYSGVLQPVTSQADLFNHSLVNSVNQKKQHGKEKYETDAGKN
ncbi:MAG: hypothetical protein R3281_07605 [Balneolaceae bacterium]|nr:hypothetical protein [Balneolaceae bacterium]